MLGLLRDTGSGAARILLAQGVDLEAGRSALARLGEQGVVPGPRPSDAQLLGALGIDLGAVRRSVEQAFGRAAVQQAVREATRARRGGIGRVPRSPLQGPPMLAVRALQLSREQATALGIGAITSELLLLGVLMDTLAPWPRCMSHPWRRQLHVAVGLPAGYRGAAGGLLVSLGVDPRRLHAAVLAELGATVP